MPWTVILLRHLATNHNVAGMSAAQMIVAPKEKATERTAALCQQFLEAGRLRDRSQSLLPHGRLNN